ncbi:hypothetical protein QAD02_001477 [Eretmocerus hayati]|uniref:Uncharacterized protein n=1 Tax=Eretmocerus hayati TaxID=131215 RepID=A0ACC2NHC8_9HYME|nr:hypothetical protein QAD02_001477 [Eretmocerus hayati]
MFSDSLEVYGPSRIVAIDGTSCCYKTTILNRLSDGKYYKVQRFNRSTRSNSVGKGMLAYLCSGKFDMSTLNFSYDRRTRYSDRSITNVLFWDHLWTMLDLYDREFGLTTSIEQAIERHGRLRVEEEYLATFDDTFENLANCREFKFFEAANNTIAIIDTDEDRVRATLRTRNEGDDEERGSKWPVYVTLQNRAYRKVYDSNCLDLAALRNTDDTSSCCEKRVVAIVCDIVKDFMTRVETKNDTESVARYAPPLLSVNKDYRNRAYDAERCDPLKKIVRSHVRRSVSRTCSKRIKNGVNGTSVVEDFQLPAIVKLNK